MNRTTVALLILISTCANSVVADTANFAGMSAKLGINQLSLDNEYTDYIDDGVAVPTLVIDKVDDGKTAAEIAISYTWALSDKYLLSLGYESTLGSQDYGRVGYSVDGIRQTGANDYLSVEVDSSSSFIIAPGLLVSDDTAILFRVGQSRLKTKTTDPSVDGVYTTTHSGILYGLGFETNFSESLFFYGSYDFVDYDDETINLVPDPDPSSLVQKASTSSMKLGIGFRF